MINYLFSFFVLLLFIQCKSRNTVLLEKYPNGTKKIVQIKNIVEGNDSLVKFIGYRENGSMSFSGFKIGEKLDSTFTQWYMDSEQISSASTYKMGLKQGVEQEWYRNGIKKSETNYNFDLKHGVEIQWYENGKKMSEGSWDEGRNVEEWTYWYENGIKKSEGMYKGGEFEKLSSLSSKSVPEFVPAKHGRWTYWNEQGVVERTEEWERGNLKDVK
jgi:antitoxin component YwqK of YwqJK toxin-antitoxin module